MLKDPKQFLLLHGEKVVFVAMLLLLLLVIWAYHPWQVQVKQASLIRTNEQAAKDLLGQPSSQINPKEPDFSDRLDAELQKPWNDDTAPKDYTQGKGIFYPVYARGGTIDQGEPAQKDPPVRPIRKVYAKSDMERVIVVFQIDDAAEHETLVDAGMPQLTNGLEIDHLVILRFDDKGNEEPVTPPGWRPQNLPVGARYGDVGTGRGTMRPVPERVYVFAQERGLDPARDRRLKEDEKRAREMKAARERAAEQKRIAEKMMQEQQQRERDAALKGGRKVPRPPNRKRPAGVAPKRVNRKGPAPVAKGDPAARGYFYFIDTEKLDPARTYRYKVIIYCKNPLPKEKAKSLILKSYENSSELSNPAKVESFKVWYFTGGSTNPESATFKVRSYVGASTEINADRINRIIAEFEGGAKAAEGGLAAGDGRWAEQSARARPGEEIGKLDPRARVGDEVRPVDFSTGCEVVAVENAVQVIEETETVKRAAGGGKMIDVEVLRRRIYPHRLRLSYIDGNGELQTRWVERAPDIRTAAR